MKLAKHELITISLVSLSVFSGSILATTHSHADDNSTANASVTISAACTISGTGGNSHTATLNPGTYSGASGSEYANGIGKTTLTAFCNDNNGFSIYAIGYSNDTDGTNTLIGQNTNINIGTKVYESSDTTSNWSMKVDKVTNSAQSYNPANMSITNSFDSWHVVPDTYTKVAQYHASTGSSATDATLGAKVETTYATFISTVQPADTYQGKVKYVMVHPFSHNAPTVPPSPSASCSTPVPNITYMQEITSSNKASVLASLTTGSPYYLRDSRDNEPYCVSKLQDGNLWSLDNLRLDLTDGDIVSNLSPQNTNADATSLISLKNGNRANGDQYATEGLKLTNESWYHSSDYSFSAPMVNISFKDTLATSFGNGSGKIGGYYNFCAASAGSYCWGVGMGTAGPNNYFSPSTDPKEGTLYDIDGDICPAGWRMPTGGANGEYKGLYTTYSNNTEATFSAFSAIHSGYMEIAQASVFEAGYFWSSTWASDSGDPKSYIDTLTIGGSSYFGATSCYPRQSGLSVRCILR